MWQAKFNDGNIINEMFIRNGLQVERSFNDVLRNVSSLDTLSIIQKSKIFSISMADGKFKVIQDTIPFEFYAIDFNVVKSKKLSNIRPIYFIRETIEFKEAIKHSIVKGTVPVIEFTALGFQGNIDGKNIKRYLSILPDGTFAIEGI